MFEQGLINIIIKYLEVVLLILLSVISDMRTYKIKNAIILSFILIGMTTNAITDGFSGLVFSLEGFAGPVLLLFVFFILRMLGAGDIKLFSAIGAVMGLEFVLYTIAYAFIAGGIMALTILAANRNGKQRLAYLCNYIKTCILTFSILPYTDFKNKNDGGKFRFSYAIALGALAQAISISGIFYNMKL